MPITSQEIRLWIECTARVIQEKSGYLTELDAAIGDADHGTNMSRGFKAVSEKIVEKESADIGTLLKTVGTTLVSTVGGASGPLYGTAYLRMGIATSNKTEINDEELLAMLAAAIEGIKTRGKAQPGDKTMLDAFIPALEAARKTQTDGGSRQEILRHLVAGANDGMQQTILLVAKKGRASYLGERSAGHQDPGATSCYLILQALADSIEKKQKELQPCQ